MPSRFEKYTVRDDRTVVLDVLIGEAQPGGTTVFLGTDQIAHTEPGGKMSVEGLDVGKGVILRGKLLVISTDVLDLRETDKASVTVVLREDPVETEVTQRKEGTPFKTVNFLTVIEFI